MKEIVFSIEKKITEELINLRRIDFFNNEFSNDIVVDEFDNISFFPVLKFNNEIIGASRVTNTLSASVLDKWSKGTNSTPKGGDCYDITRTVIKNEWRMKGMYHTLTILLIQYLVRNKAKTLNTILVKSEKSFLHLHDYILRLGSIKCGEPYICYDPPCMPLTVQAYTLNLHSNTFPLFYQREYQRIINTVNHRNFQIISKI
jgi:hypothetical protein